MATSASSSRHGNPIDAVREVVDRARRLLKLELELRLLEGKRRAITGGIGAGLGLAALLLLPLVVAFLLAAAAAALATTVSVWLAILIVGAGLLGVVLALALAAALLIRKAVVDRGDDRG
jgi:uncharacterized membrane protein